jgi:hypothetical protein
MHGSLNWISKSISPEKISIEQNIRNLMNKESIELEVGKYVPLIPPTWKRGTENKDVFSKMISQAINELRFASKIVILGYSIPDYDIYFKYMLARALNTPEFPEIQVWDVKERSEVIGRLKNIFGEENFEQKRVQYFKGGLKAFVTSHFYSQSENV